MIFFGHLGFGLKLANPFLGQKSGRFPLKWLLVGTLLPDVIDKSLYYGLSWLNGLRGADLGLISGTRTLGHSALFLLLLAGFAALLKSRPLAALTLGVATHLLVDHLGDSIGHAIWPSFDQPQFDAQGRNLSLVGLLWPFMGARF